MPRSLVGEGSKLGCGRPTAAIDQEMDVPSKGVGSALLVLVEPRPVRVAQCSGLGRLHSRQYAVHAGCGLIGVFQEGQRLVEHSLSFCKPFWPCSVVVARVIQK